MQWVLRLLARTSPILHAWWQGGEGVCGRVSRLQTGEIVAALGEWPAIVADRQQKVELAWPLAPSWLSRSAERLPCAVPVLVDVGPELVHELGLTAGMRTMEKVEDNGTRTLVKVLPIPIHQDVSLVWLRRVLARIAKPAVRS
jgi:putative PLP-dependent aminotransferase (TIGR04422 family)